MRGNRTTSYAVIVLAAATLVACGGSGDGGSTTTSGAASPSASATRTASGAGDLQLRQAESAQTPAAKPCTAAPVAPETPTYRCDRGSGLRARARVRDRRHGRRPRRSRPRTGLVQVTLDAAGTKALADATTRMATLLPPEGLLGIMSGGFLYGAPLVQTPVTDGVFVISGLVSLPDAVSLASQIRG
jgi:hypothetical protein